MLCFLLCIRRSGGAGPRGGHPCPQRHAAGLLSRAVPFLCCAVGDAPMGATFGDTIPCSGTALRCQPHVPMSSCSCIPPSPLLHIPMSLCPHVTVSSFPRLPVPHVPTPPVSVSLWLHCPHTPMSPCPCVPCTGGIDTICPHHGVSPGTAHRSLLVDGKLSSFH